MDRLRIVTRKSPLALWQAAHVRDLILRKHSHLEIELVGVSTLGDRTRDPSLLLHGGKGVFLKELESLMLAGDAELAIHSMKDVPLTVPEGLEVSTVGQRGDVRDAYVGQKTLDVLPHDARIGSSSLRRKALIAALWNRTNVEPVRGNVQTRLTKLDHGQFDALILAVAGLQRLNLQTRITHFLDPTTFVPAVGQGALAVEYPVDRMDVKSIVSDVRDENVERGVSAERQITMRLDADCAMPIGVYSEMKSSESRIVATVLSPDGEQCLRVEMRGDNPMSVADSVADRLLKLGAKPLMTES